MTTPDSRHTSMVARERRIDDLPAPRINREAERRDRDMNAFAILVVNQHLESLLEEAANERLAKDARKAGLRKRIASALTSVKSVMTDTAESSSVLPALSDYPYRT
jgi:hypothetical protein